MTDDGKEIGWLIRDALFGEAYCAFMCAENPDISDETRQAYKWAEKQFIRIANQQVDDRDIVG